MKAEVEGCSTDHFDCLLLAKTPKSFKQHQDQDQDQDQQQERRSQPYRVKPDSRSYYKSNITWLPQHQKIC